MLQIFAQATSLRPSLLSFSHSVFFSCIYCFRRCCSCFCLDVAWGAVWIVLDRVLLFMIFSCWGFGFVGVGFVARGCFLGKFQVLAKRASRALACL